jgi:hypothetical protein
MRRGTIDINKQFELEYRYFDKDSSYKYFNRKFEIYLLEKKPLKKNYILHMDNCDTGPGKWSPHIHKTPAVNKKLYFAATTLNWNDVQKNLTMSIIGEIGEDHQQEVKQAVSKLTSPKI